MRLTKLPGTTIEAHLEPMVADKILTPMFYSGGLVLSQVAQITGLEGHTVQNWIKRKFLSHPENKKYNREQLCRIMNINILKDCFTLDQTEFILNYINNAISGDDSFDDSDLYQYFVNVLAALQCGRGASADAAGLDAVIAGVITDYEGNFKFMRHRLAMVLKIMVTAYESLEIKLKAMELYQQLDFQ